MVCTGVATETDGVPTNETSAGPFAPAMPAVGDGAVNAFHNAPKLNGWDAFCAGWLGGRGLHYLPRTRACSGPLFVGLLYKELWVYVARI